MMSESTSEQQVKAIKIGATKCRSDICMKPTYTTEQRQQRIGNGRATHEKLAGRSLLQPRRSGEMGSVGEHFLEPFPLGRGVLHSPILEIIAIASEYGVIVRL